MSKPNDETLLAYADGLLSQRDAAMVQRQLETDAELRRFVEALQRSQDLACAAFEQPMHEPAPQAMVDVIMTAPIGAFAAAAAANVLILPAASRRGPSRWGAVARPAMAMAASVAVLVAGIAGYQLGRQGPAGSLLEIALGPVPAASVIHELLERQPSGAVLSVGHTSTAAARRLSVIATFRDRQARPCREIELLDDATESKPIMTAVACRGDNGTWIVQGAARLAEAGVGGADQSFKPSGKPAGGREKDVLDGLLLLLGTGQALSPADERETIGKDWK